nr:hypothetical protein [Candidatus Bathyarchaeota archaeon]
MRGEGKIISIRMGQDWIKMWKVFLVDSLEEVRKNEDIKRAGYKFLWRREVEDADGYYIYIEAPDEFFQKESIKKLKEADRQVAEKVREIILSREEGALEGLGSILG